MEKENNRKINAESNQKNGYKPNFEMVYPIKDATENVSYAIPDNEEISSEEDTSQQR